MPLSVTTHLLLVTLTQFRDICGFVTTQEMSPGDVPCPGDPNKAQGHSGAQHKPLLLLDPLGMRAGSTSGCLSLPTDPHGTTRSFGGHLWGFIFCIKIFILETT